MIALTLRKILCLQKAALWQLREFFCESVTNWGTCFVAEWLRACVYMNKVANLFNVLWNKIWAVMEGPCLVPWGKKKKIYLEERKDRKDWGDTKLSSGLTSHCHPSHPSHTSVIWAVHSLWLTAVPLNINGLPVPSRTRESVRAEKQWHWGCWGGG